MAARTVGALAQLDLTRPLSRDLGQGHGTDASTMMMVIWTISSRSVTPDCLIDPHVALPARAGSGAFAALSNREVWIATGDEPALSRQTPRARHRRRSRLGALPPRELDDHRPCRGFAAVHDVAVPSRFKNSPSNAWRNSKTFGS